MSHSSVRCEILDCDGGVVAVMNGIDVCERCLEGFVSVGFGAVCFSGRYHGVRGAPYTTFEAATHPGLIAAAARTEVHS